MRDEQRNRIITGLLHSGESLGFDKEGWSKFLSKFLVGETGGDAGLEKVQHNVNEIINNHCRAEEAWGSLTAHDLKLLRDCGIKWEGWRGNDSKSSKV